MASSSTIRARTIYYTIIYINAFAVAGSSHPTAVVMYIDGLYGGDGRTTTLFANYNDIQQHAASEYSKYCKRLGCVYYWCTTSLLIYHWVKLVQRARLIESGQHTHSTRQRARIPAAAVESIILYI